MGDERPRVLVVEDSPMMTRMYRMVLGSSHDLVFAEDGATGLDAAASQPALDLMIVDINMPRMDGLEFIRRARSELGLDSVPALVCSTEAGEGDRAAAKAAGATGFLAKPWTPDDLLAAVAGQLGGAA